MKLFESMASNRPIIASNLKALRLNLEDHRNALLIEPDCSKSLIDAMELLQSDPTLGCRLADAAKDDVSPFSWERRAIDILSHFAPQYLRDSKRETS